MPTMLCMKCDFCNGGHELTIGKYNLWKKNNSKSKFCSAACRTSYVKEELKKTVRERFYSYVNDSPGQGPNGDCHTMNKPPGACGYPLFSLEGMEHPASWTAYWLEYGVLPDFKGKGERACHTCDFRLCVNYQHIFIGTAKDNIDDMVSKWRHCHGEGARTAKLTNTDVMIIRLMLQRGLYPGDSEAAALFGVGRTTVASVRRKLRWKHISDPIEAKDCPGLPQVHYIQATALDGSTKMIPVEPIYFDNKQPQNLFS